LKVGGEKTGMIESLTFLMIVCIIWEYSQSFSYFAIW